MDPRPGPDTGSDVAPPVVGILVPEDDHMPPGLEPLEGVADLRLARDAAELAAIIGEVEVLFVWEYRRNLLQKVWSDARRLRWVHAASAGVDAVVFPELAESDVVVTNTRGVLDDAIAEWVVAVMLLFAKDLDTTLAFQRAHRWKHRESERLADRRVLVVGAGSIGRAIARLSRAMGMVVEGVARSARSDDPDFVAVVAADRLSERLTDADFVVVAVPLTADTRGLIGREALRAMRTDARLINVGRGPVVDEGALLDALRSGDIAGAALDVFDDEPLPSDHPFWDLPNVVVSPHMSGDFIGWQGDFSQVFVENFRRWRDGETLINVVDKEQAVAPVSPT